MTSHDGARATARRSPGDRTARPQSIASRVIVLVASGLVATIAVLGFVAARAMRESDEAMETTRAGVARWLADATDERLTTLLATLQGVAGAARPEAEGMAPARSVETLRAAYLQSAYLDGVQVLTRSLDVLAADGEVPGDFTTGALAGVARAALSRDGPTVSPVIEGAAVAGDDRRGGAAATQSGGDGSSAASGPWVLLFVPIKDWRGETAGLVAGTCNLRGRRFQALVSPLQRPPAPVGSVELVDERGRIIASSRRGDAFRLAADTGGAVAAGAPLTITRWSIVIRRPAASVVGGRRALATTLVWLAPLLLGLSLFFAWGAGRSVARPLGTLTDAAERITRGDLEAPIPVRGRDEVGRLGRAFEHMRIALKRSLDDIAAANAALEGRVERRTRELADANRALAEREAIRQQLLRKVITAQEDERKRLARELHDDPAQTVTALLVGLDAALAAAPSGDARTRLEQARALAARTLEELHRLMHDLRPALLDDMGLVAALRWYADRHLAARGVAVRFEVSAGTGRLSYEHETALFRAAQEAITNIERHAGAEMVLIQIADADRRFRIEIEDDGQGFDPASVEPRPGEGRGLGLLGIRERIELLGGTVKIESAPGRGTHVLLEVPLSPGEGNAEDPRADR